MNSLFSLSGGSSLTIANNGLVTIAAGSIFRVTGTNFGFFGAGTNSLVFTNAPLCGTSCVQLGTTGFNVLLLNGAVLTNISLDPSFTGFAGLDANNTVAGLGSRALIVLDGANSQLQLGANTLQPLIITSGVTDFSAGTSQFFSTALISGGTLTGSDAVSFAGLFDWSGGNMLGTGATTANAGMTLSGGATKVLGRTLVNPAGQSALWSGGNIGFQDAAMFTNLGTFRAAHAGNLSLFNAGGTGSKIFDNQGTFIKEAPALGVVGETIIGNPIAFNNSGSVQIQAGNLSLQGGGSHTGTFDVAAGTSLDFDGGTHAFSGGGLLTGAGNVNLTAGTLNATGPIDRLVGSLNIPGGTLNAAGPLVALIPGQILNPTSNMINISGGNLNATGSLPLFNLLGGTLNVVAGNHLLNMTGGITNLNTGFLRLNSGSNATLSSLFSLSGNSALAIGNDALVNVSGGSIFRLTSNSLGSFGAGTNTLSFGNAPLCGTSCVQLGSTGFNVLLLNGAVLTNISLDPSFTGFSGLGGTNTIAGLTTGGDRALFVLDGTTSQLQLGQNVLAPLIITSGITNFSSGTNPSFPSARISGGTLTGSDAVSITGLTSWTGGTMSGTGLTNANGGMDISGSGTKPWIRAFLNNARYRQLERRIAASQQLSDTQ